MRVPDAPESHQEANGYILFAILFLNGPVVFFLTKQMRALSHFKITHLRKTI